MSRQQGFLGNPLMGGPIPRPEAPIRQNPSNILWQQSPSTIELTDAIRAFSRIQQLISSLTIFADQANVGNATVGNGNIGGSGAGVNFQLAPGRSATIYTDDWEHEVFDLSKFYTISTVNAAGLLYLTVWTPVIIR